MEVAAAWWNEEIARRFAYDGSLWQPMTTYVGIAHAAHSAATRAIPLER